MIEGMGKDGWASVVTGCHPAPILEAAEHDLGTVAYSLQARPSARANLEICKLLENHDKPL